MHELSIASAIVENILQFAGEHQIGEILEVKLSIGELTCIQDEQLRFCFEAIAKETPIGNSALAIERVGAKVLCPHCSYSGAPKYLDETVALAPIVTLECPQCGKTTDVVQGHECSIKSLRYVT